MNLVDEACPIGHEDVVGGGTIALGCSAVGDRRAGVAYEGFDITLEIGDCALVVIFALLGGEGTVLDYEGSFLAFRTWPPRS